ncbi:MAG: hypothetical protein ACJAXW_003502 [Candidatus Azotimanducaceae bacterium]|jgi:hypothetical protein
MARRALLVGINDYDNLNDLSCCVRDAEAMACLLARDDDSALNYE